MRKSVVYIFTVVCLLFSFGFSIQAQNIESLRKERREIQERINQTNKQLKQTQHSEKLSTKKLNALQRNLKERKKLIENYNQQIKVLDSKISRLTNERIQLEKQLEEEKGEYANLIRKKQTNMNSYSKIMFLFSAKDFDQSIRRARYLRDFSNYKKNQVKKIEQVKNQIALKTDSLDQNKSDKVQTLNAKQTEANRLKVDEKNEKVMLTGLKQQEKRLSEEYRAQQRKRDQIDNKIQQVMEEEIRKEEARRRAEEANRKAQEEARIRIEERKKAEAKAAEKKRMEAAQGKKSTETAKTESKASETSKTVAASKSSEAVSALTKEEILLSGRFENNRGRLPWPLDKGIISGHFGLQNHPNFKYVTINNKGVYFRSPVGTNARAVYDGEVKRIFSLPGSGNAIIIQHGNYRTVYGILSNVFVHVGQNVSTKQALGKIFTDEDTGQAELQFQIWNGSTLLNPEGWIVQ
jgi:septal ring factor EnvC (AmiA/AmiB activator)